MFRDRQDDEKHEDYVEEALRTIISNQEKLMTVEDDQVAAQAKLDAAIAQVGTDVAALEAKVASLDPAAAAAVTTEVAALTASNAALAAIDTSVNPPAAPAA